MYDLCITYSSCASLFHHNVPDRAEVGALWCAVLSRVQGCPFQADPSWARASPQFDAGHWQEAQEESTTGIPLHAPGALPPRQYLVSELDSPANKSLVCKS